MDRLLLTVGTYGTKVPLEAQPHAKAVSWWTPPDADGSQSVELAWFSKFAPTLLIPMRVIVAQANPTDKGKVEAELWQKACEVEETLFEVYRLYTGLLVHCAIWQSPRPQVRFLLDGGRLVAVFKAQLIPIPNDRLRVPSDQIVAQYYDGLQLEEVLDEGHVISLDTKMVVLKASTNRDWAAAIRLSFGPAMPAEKGCPQC